MSELRKFFYCPALRMKLGELEGVRALAPDIADYVLPRFIVPPPSERDDGLQQKLIDTPARPEIASLLLTHWGNRQVLVDVTYLLDEFGRGEMSSWLPQMFERAHAANVPAILTLHLDDLINGNHIAYAAAVETSIQLQLGLVISSGDLSDRERLNQAIRVIDKIGLSPEQCLVSADFHDADLGAPEIVSPIIAAALEDLQLLAPWQKVVFQGTNYPASNQADPGSRLLIPRNEWTAWKQAVAFDPGTAAHLLFGDYAADCSKIVFGKGHGRAIPHYRYTTPESWLLQRGPETGRSAEVMRKVCKAIVESGLFAGRYFSGADEHIFRMAHGLARPGTAKDWRAVNTTHHITRVVNDIGTVKGVQFKRLVREEFPQQNSLFAQG